MIENDPAVARELERVINQDLGMVCVGCCHSGKAALRQLPGRAPDVLLVDLSLRDGSGLGFAARLRRMTPSTRFVVLTVHTEPEYRRAALACGASGYLVKPASPDAIRAAIARAVRDPQLVTFVAAGQDQLKLSAGEQLVLSALANGLPPRQAYLDLRLARSTFSGRLRRILGKLKVRTRDEAVIRWLAARGPVR